MIKKSLLFLLLMTLFAPWAVAQEPIPYNEGFESMSDAADLTAAGWLSYQSSSGSFLEINTANVHTGTKALNIDSWDAASSSDWVIVALPDVDADINTLQISFWYKVSTGTVYVGYVTDETDLNGSFQSIATFTASSSYKSTGDVDLSTAPATAKRIAIKYLNWYRCYIDDIEVKVLPTCDKPTLSNDVTTTTNTATISWTPATGHNLFDIYWSTSNTAPTDATTPSAANQTGTSYTISGLNPSASYYVWIRGNCGTATEPDVSGGWTNAVSFDTQCQASAALGYDEKFDTYTYSSGFLPNCWTRINEGTSYDTYPSIYNSNAYSTSNCLRFYVYGSSTTTTIADQYAVLPEMTGLNGLQITFMARGYNSGNSFKIGQMSDPTDISTFNEIGSKTLTTTYEECNFILTNKGNYIAILMEKPTSSSSTTIGVYIDNISIHTPPTCIKPTNLDGTASGLNATVTWESEESQWQVAYSTDATADPDANIEGLVDVKTFTKNGLSLGDHYFWVRSYCSASDQSDWVGPVSVHIGYCLPSINNVDGNGFTNITYGTGENIVNNDVPKTTYADYTNLVGAVQAGVEATVTITNSTGYDYGTIIWVDLDNSLSFEDSEIVFAYNIPNQTTPYAATFIIPATQTVGDYVMRIGAADSSFDSYVKGQTTTPPSACFSTNWGTCQDYTLRVLEKPSCMTPTALNVTTDGATAIATWSGEGTSYNIDINGTVTNNVTCPYEFTVALSTDYAVKVQANCSGSETSDWSNTFSFTTPPCVGGHTIEYTLTDGYGDGWEGAYITIIEGCGEIVETLTVADGASLMGTITLCGDYYEFVYTQGDYPSEYSWTFTEGSTTLFSGTGSSSSTGDVLYTIGTPAMPKPTGLTAGTPDYDNVDLSWTETGTATAWEICINGDETNLVTANTNVNFNLTGLQPDNSYSIKVRSVNKSEISCWSNEITVTTPVACARPTDLTEANITFTTADLSWTGTADSYVAEYGTWTQAGTDQTATGTMTPYTFSLSGFSGKGTVAIRHYNVNDQFRLNVDDIVVKNATGDIIYSENFENGSIPGNMSVIDLDGDGNNWFHTSVGINGTGGVTSASWVSGTVLYPDNWLVISDITLGGSITFNAVGQDPSAPAENFGVFVIADSQFTEAYNGTGTSCQVTGLTEGTAYAWRVQADCGGSYPSNWAFSMFKTKDDLLIFATDGDWNKLSNWTDLDGNPATALPTTNTKVRIDANATIPTGVVATAKNATLNGGSIEIADGGQLKQGGSVKVTMHKGIEGYGTGNEADRDHYYFIATPHNCSYLEVNSTFPYVLNVTDGKYDLYAFDATNTALEWINYESNSTHTEFHQGNNTGLFNKKGYLYANEEDKDLEYVGTVSSSLNSTLTESFTYDGTLSYPFNGWKLVGNPYSCDAYINYVDTEGHALSADFYTLNNDKEYTLSSSKVALAPLTGAFINCSATGTIQFSSENPDAKSSGVLNMTLNQGHGKVDQARIRFGEGFNLEHMSFRNSSRLYMTQNNTNYAVVRAENEGEMPVNFKAEENGTYTLSFSNEDVEFGYLHLIDNLTGNDVDLLATPSYTFDARYTDYASRFKLVYATANTSDDQFAFINNGQIILSGVTGNTTVQLFDITGRMISSTNGTNHISIENMTAGVYVLRLINGNDVKTQKIVVK